jgi:hypothetical protein
MKTFLKIALICAVIAGCSRSGRDLGPTLDLGDFRLGHNVVVAENVTKGPFSPRGQPGRAAKGAV